MHYDNNITQFIQKYVKIDGDDNIDDDEYDGDGKLVSLDDFIDNSEQQQEEEYQQMLTVICKCYFVQRRSNVVTRNTIFWR